MSEYKRNGGAYKFVFENAYEYDYAYDSGKNDGCIVNRH